MNILDSQFSQYVIPTDASIKKKVDGIINTYQVYKIRLDLLYYNDKNDRIATWMSKYKAENQVNEINMDNKEEYNSIIQEFIIESNRKAITKTKNSIEIGEQEEPGVVLLDGRIVDGNRRFTCLRLLTEKNDKFNYFEAIVLQKDIDKDIKQIKKLELEIQQGKDEKVDYNPIEKLVGIYNDIEVNKVLTVQEYANCIGANESVIKEKLEQSKLMVEFLEFIGTPNKYYIARDLSIDGPLLELMRAIKKCKNKNIEDDIKTIAFSNIIVEPKGDITRFIRPLKDIVASEYAEDFISEQIDYSFEVLKSLPQDQKTNEKTIAETVRSNEALKEKLLLSMDKVTEKIKRTETKNRPVQLLDKGYVNFESIDKKIISKLTLDECLLIKCKINDIQIILDEISNEVNHKIEGN